MEPEPFPVVEDAAQFRGEVAQRIVRELHRMGGKHRRGHRADLYAHAGEDRDRYGQRGAPEARHVVDRGDSGYWIAHGETPGKGLGGGEIFFRRVSSPELPLSNIFGLLGRESPHCFSRGKSFPHRGRQIKLPQRAQKRFSITERVCYACF